MFKDSVWASRLLAAQKEDGSWGYFHTLSEPKKYPVTTEQALRRLEALGFTISDAPIARAVSYMVDCLTGRNALPDRREKLHDWDSFTAIMLAAWIRRFTPDCPQANAIAGRWADVITAAFADGAYDHAAYLAAYQNVFGMQPRGGRFVDFVSFYQISLLADMLDIQTERAMLDYVLHHPDGIYYVCEGPLAQPPGEFASKRASRYLAAMELLTRYPSAPEKLAFVADWLETNRTPDSMWDMGAASKDGVYFPLSDSWRRAEVRKTDCTYRIEKLLAALKSGTIL